MNCYIMRKHSLNSNEPSKYIYGTFDLDFFSLFNFNSLGSFSYNFELLYLHASFHFFLFNMMLVEHPS